MDINEIRKAVRVMYPLDGPIRVSHFSTDDLGEYWACSVADSTNTDIVASVHVCHTVDYLLKEIKSQVGWRSRSQPE